MVQNSYSSLLNIPSILSPEPIEAFKNKPQFLQNTAQYNLLSLLTGYVFVSIKDQYNAVELYTIMEKILAVTKEDSTYFCIAGSNPPKRLRDLTAGPRVDYLKVPTPAWKGELKFQIQTFMDSRHIVKQQEFKNIAELNSRQILTQTNTPGLAPVITSRTQDGGFLGGGMWK